MKCFGRCQIQAILFSNHFWAFAEMRNLFSVALSFILLFVITGCGQSGALMLPSDPNYDKRSNYILHKKVQPENLSNHNESDTSSPDTQQN